MPTPLTKNQQYWSTQLQNSEAFEGSIADHVHSQDVSTQARYRCAIACAIACASVIFLQASTDTVVIQVVSTALPSSSLMLAVSDAILTFTRLPDPQCLAHFLSLSRSEYGCLVTLTLSLPLLRIIDLF